MLKTVEEMHRTQLGQLRVLGIDCQTRGIAVVSLYREDSAHKCIWLPIRGRKTGARLANIYFVLEKAIAGSSPPLPIIYIERPPYVKNYITLLRLAQVQGTIIASFTARGFTVKEIDPPAWKLAVTGNGNASKEQVKTLMMMRLGLKDNFPQDIYDAASIALAGLIKEKWRLRTNPEDDRC